MSVSTTLFVRLSGRLNLLFSIWPSLFKFTMAEKDISVLMSGMNLYSAQQQNKYAPVPGGYNTDESKPHTRRCRHRLRLQKVDDEKLSPNHSQKSNRRMQKGEQALRVNNNTKIPEQFSPLKVDSSSQAITRERRAVKGKSSAAGSSSLKIGPSHVYVA